MNKSFAIYLNETKPNGELIEIAARTFLSEITNDALPNEMIGWMIKAGIDREELEKAIAAIEKEAQHRCEASLAFLCWGWQDPANRDKITEAFHGSQSKLPVIDNAILALVAIYGMYLLTTHGVKKETRVIKKHKDGTYEEKTITEYESPAGPLSVLTKLFSGIPGHGKSKVDEP